MQNLNDSIPDLKIEHITDGLGDGLIMLTQDNCGNVDSVAIHPIHLRYIAEKMGLIESSDPKAQKTIATLRHQMLTLRERIDHIANWLANHSDHKHADLSYEMTYATATADIAEAFCYDLSESGVASLGGNEIKPTEPSASPQASLI